jgi:3-oxoacyl-[acyl-carrier protein] reductase
LNAEKRIVLVTGASSGIGRAIALRLAKDGFHVLVHCHRNEAGAKETGAGVSALGGRWDLLRFDVTDRAAVDRELESFFSSAAEGRMFFGLVNNAGIHADALAGMMSDEMFDSVMQSNVYGPFYLMRWAVKRMIRQRSGCIVNVASLSGQTGNPGQINYAASKAALIAMTKTLAMEVGSRGIRVNAVAPGFIETGMIDKLPIDAIKERIPLRRFGTVDEVAGTVSFLCSPDASYITGHTVSVNGGLFPS